MKNVEFEGKVIEVKKTSTIKEDTEIEEQTVKIKTLEDEVFTIKGPVGFMDDIILDSKSKKVCTKNIHCCESFLCINWIFVLYPM